MQLHIQTLVDDCGNPVAVQIPFNEWTQFYEGRQNDKKEKQSQKLEQKLTRAFNDVEKMKKGELPETTLDEVLARL